MIILDEEKEAENEEKNDEDFIPEAKPSMRRMPSSRRVSQEGKGGGSALGTNTSSNRSGRRLKQQPSRQTDDKTTPQRNGAATNASTTASNSGRRRRSLADDKESLDGDIAKTSDDSVVIGVEDGEESGEGEGEDDNEEEDGADNDEDEKVDLWMDTSCRLCEKKDFTSETENLVRHYATAHFKARLDAELRRHSDFNCNVCKAKRLKHVFATRREFASHLAIFHNRVAIWLADELGVEVIDTKPKSMRGTPTPAGRSLSSGGRRAADTTSIVSNSSSSSSSNNGKASSPSLADAAPGKRRSQR